MKLKNYIHGEWIEGEGSEKVLLDASTGEEVAVASAKGVDFDKIYKYGREIGGQHLRKMTFRERGLMLKKLALHLYKIKDQFYPISYKTGATNSDSWIDIEGGIGNLFANASLRKKFPDQTFYVDGEMAVQGVAMVVNPRSFNFELTDGGDYYPARLEVYVSAFRGSVKRLIFAVGGNALYDG